MDPRIKVVVADITTLELDAIVNAANNSLLGGGGVDGAIHRKAGPKLADYCSRLGGCQTGDAKITPGFNLPARQVIHTVGPVWNGGDKGEAALLASCYKRSLHVAMDHGVRSLAFPAISTGVYRFPAGLAAEIAVKTVTDVIHRRGEIELVLFCCFSEAAGELVEARLKALEAAHD
ncbi:MAG TPA: O-acetyl-ADP-ribose deacetylase [Caulobacteraceae bacterium]|jgi:O-acetyl-ADP-ribose deacetylase (regulator of RNase III)